MRQCSIPGLDTVLDIAYAQKVIGEASVDKLLSAVASLGHQQKAAPRDRDAGTSTIEHGGDPI
jgi:hypothetical protein